jgi:hypothetical protein
MMSAPRTQTRSPLADFAEALATFNAHPTIEAFREVQLAGRLLEVTHRTDAAKDRELFASLLSVPSTKGGAR